MPVSIQLINHSALFLFKAKQRKDKKRQDKTGQDRKGRQQRNINVSSNTNHISRFFFKKKRKKGEMAQDTYGLDAPFHFQDPFSPSPFLPSFLTL
jgi:hypothetical protein